MPDETTYLVALHSIPGMSHQALQRLIDRFGTAERVVIEATEADLRPVKGLSGEVQRGVLACRNRLSWAERIVQQMSRRGVRVLRPGNPDYPPQLKLLSAPPRVLYLLGESSRLRPPSAAIVGSTNPSPRGKFLAAEIARRLSRAGCTIVSGMAKGIDLAAHRAAIAAGGTTVFVLPTGILHFKPGAQFPPLDAWISRAAIISEWPPEAEWSASAAVARNRVIAALASAVVVVETQPEGGAMHTFRYAQELDRPLFVVKYRQPPPSASGNNAAIALGGTPLTQLSEVRHVIEAAKSGSSAACPP